MSYKIVQQVNPGITYTIPLKQGLNTDTIEVWNGTPFDLDYLGVGTADAVVIVAGTGHQFSAEEYNVGRITIVPVNNNNVAGTGVVNIVVYQKGDIIPHNRVFPVAIPTQTVQAKVSSVNTLSDEGRATGSETIDIGDVVFAKLIDIFNDGHFTWSINQSGVKHTIFTGNTVGNPLQLGQASDLLELLGSLKVDQIQSVSANGSVSGTATCYEFTIGPIIFLFINFVNFSSTTQQSMTLPTAITSNFVGISGGIGVSGDGGILIFNGATQQQTNIITSLVNTGGGVTGTAHIYQYSIFGAPATPFNIVKTETTTTSHNGFVLIAGI